MVRGAEGLINCLNSCKLSEIPSKSQFLTWTNNRTGDELVWERLDRSFANNSWLKSHDSAFLTNFRIIHSNHGAMLLTTHKETSFRMRPYRFEAIWLTHPRCEDTIKVAWEVEALGSDLFLFIQKIKRTKEALKVWNKDYFGILKQKKIVLEKELAEAQRDQNWSL